MSFPIIDIESLVQPGHDPSAVAEVINDSCRRSGFFYVKNHGVSSKLQNELENASRDFFSKPVEEKLKLDMKKGGRAWRGYFPLEAELTSGRPDLKEGLYFGEELPSNHPMVRKKVPFHGSNLFPEIPNFDALVLKYMDEMSKLGRNLMKGIALSLKLETDFFDQELMKQPLQLFRIFHYPAPISKGTLNKQWGVGEHTDYGVLTILKQDTTGGLEVYTQGKWIKAPYVADSFICNIGDMLDLLTGGYYRSTPHRVFNNAGRGRLSFPFFFDLDYNARPKPINLSHLGHVVTEEYQRWDNSMLQAFSGKYGDYLTNKVSKVFPQLKNEVL